MGPVAHPRSGSWSQIWFTRFAEFLAHVGEAGSIYHALNRGNARQAIFHMNEDYEIRWKSGPFQGFRSLAQAGQVARPHFRCLPFAFTLEHHPLAVADGNHIEFYATVPGTADV
ncbi:MAG: hypothetical protein EA424_06110 [Planctomycetaceae bacterium]|nr:MAG: hypothetical protein EA424_06110 [Planctomycetaceae bacterium]